MGKVVQRNFLPLFFPGDLVKVCEWGEGGMGWDEEYPDPRETGLVLRVIDDIEIPPLVEVLWDNGYMGRIYQDDLIIVGGPRKKT